MPTTWRPHLPWRAAVSWRGIPRPINRDARGHIRRMIRAPYPVVTVAAERGGRYPHLAATVRRDIIARPEDAA